MRGKEGGIFRSTLTITSFSLLAGVFNYLTLVILASSFGAGKEMDAFFAAITVSQIIITVLSAVLMNTFVPLFIEARIKDESRAWKMASVSINLFFLVLLVMAASCSLASQDIMSLISPGLHQGTRDLAAFMFRIFMVSTIFSGLSILLTSLYYSRHRFFRPMTAQASNTLTVFLFVLFLRSAFGIKSVAVGTLTGSLIQFLLLLPIFLARSRYRLAFDWRMPEMARLARLMLPLLAGSVFYKAGPLVERYLASGLEEGSISYLGYAGKIVGALLILSTQGLSTAIFPKMSECAARSDLEGLKDTLSRALQILVIIIVPTLFVLVLARYQVTRLVFERGSFTGQSTQAVGSALVAYLGYFAAAVLILPIVNAFYSLKETDKPAAVGIVGFVLYVVLASVLSRRLSYLGIALALSTQFVLSLGAFLFFIRRKLKHWSLRPILSCALRAFLASALACLLLLAIHRPIQSLLAFPFDLIGLLSIGTVFYFLFSLKLNPRQLGFIGRRFLPGQKAQP